MTLWCEGTTAGRWCAIFVNVTEKRILGAAYLFDKKINEKEFSARDRDNREIAQFETREEAQAAVEKAAGMTR